MALEYITTRELQNSSGKFTGKIKVIKLREEPEAEVDYICSDCGFSEKKEESWKKPFSIRCSKCRHLIKVPSLKSEIKKMRKK